MATLIKWVLAVLIIGGGIWFAWSRGWLTKPAQAPTTTPPVTETTPPAPTNGMSAATDTSDAAIAQDAAAVDVQLAAMVKDVASVDAALNDKAISQDY